MDTINWREQEDAGSWQRPNLVAFALIECMADKAGMDVKGVFAPFDPEALVVEFRINGIEVSFLAAMERIQNAVAELESEIKKSILREAAEKLIGELQSNVATW